MDEPELEEDIRAAMEEHARAQRTQL